MQDCPLLITRALTAVDDGFLDIGAGHHDEWIAAAQFQHHFLDALGRGDADLDAGLLAAGEGCGGDARIVQDAIDLRGANQQRLKNARGKTGAKEDVLDFQGALRNV